MGWFDGVSEVGSSTSHHRRSKSSSGSKYHHSSHSPRASSIFNLGDPSSSKSHREERPRASSLFGLGGGESSRHDREREKPRGSSIFGMGDGRHNSSRSTFFGAFGGGRSSSYYKRSPRSGYLKRVYAKLRRLLRDLIYYMKKNPMKVFMLVIMPLITGGALTGLLAKFGMRLPPGLQKLFGAGGRGGSGVEYERSKMSASGPIGAMGGVASAMGGMGGIGGAMSLAKMFM